MEEKDGQSQKRARTAAWEQLSYQSIIPTKKYRETGGKGRPVSKRRARMAACDQSLYRLIITTNKKRETGGKDGRYPKKGQGQLLAIDRHIDRLFQPKNRERPEERMASFQKKGKDGCL